ncbi:HEPN domain-containing protein [bacterium]|nr:HEPN domain-containing protein [bacterium]MBU1153999.1 HEPN domain-containing protein [bacterium]MBU1782633.1 HEPN domain-containing protein [bacterium]
MNPSKKRRLLVLPEEWLKSALSDLKLGKLGKENGDILEEQICFHTQQAAEKAVKWAEKYMAKTTEITEEEIR